MKQKRPPKDRITVFNNPTGLFMRETGADSAEYGYLVVQKNGTVKWVKAGR